MTSRDAALFLDRDGVINQRLVGDYVRTIDEFILKPKLIEALSNLRQHFNNFFIVTNQQGIGKGVVSQQEVDAVHAHLQSLLRAANVPIDAIYCCPHLASANCGCRKPQIGMALQVKRDFPIVNLENSVMVGDSLSDLQFGKNAGMKTVYINDMHEELTAEIRAAADMICDNLYDFSIKMMLK